MIVKGTLASVVQIQKGFSLIAKRDRPIRSVHFFQTVKSLLKGRLLIGHSRFANSEKSTCVKPNFPVPIVAISEKVR